MADNDEGGTPGTGGTPGQSSEGTAGNGTQQPPESGTQTGQTDGTSGGAAEDTAALRKAIKEERDARKAAEARLKAIEESTLPEAEKTARRLTELEAENERLAAALVERDVQQEVTKAAAKLGVVDTDVVLILLRESDSIDFDNEGKPINVEAAIKDLVKTKPYLVRNGAAGADAGAGTRAGAAPGGGMNDVIRRAAGRT